MTIQSMTAQELYKAYKISFPTFKRWIKAIPGIVFINRKRVYTPKEVQLIYDHLGAPEIDVN